MNYRISKITFLLLTMPVFSNAQFIQDETNELPRLRLGSASVAIGAATDPTPSLNLQEFNMLATNSVLLQNDFSGFSKYDHFYNNSGVAFSVLVGIDFLDKDKTTYDKGLQLRIGINYLGGLRANQSMQRTDRFSTDTLESTQSGQVIFIDSTHYQDYTMSYSHDQLQLDLSLVYSTRTKSFLSLYAGIGVSAGVSVVSQTRISYESRFDDSRRYNDFGGYRDVSSATNEQFYNQPNFSVSGYIPLGAELRLGRNRALWNQLKLFTEMRPGISYFHLSDLNHSRATPWYQQTIGIRYVVL